MKILFLQLWYDMYGGAETVNHTLATQFKKDGYSVRIDCLYHCNKNEIIDDITYQKEYISNELKRPSYKKMLVNLSKLKIKLFYQDIIKCIKVYQNKKDTTKKLKKRIEEYNPDWIIITNPEIIKQVPTKYLKKSLIHLHSGSEEYIKNKEYKKVKKILYKYQHKIHKLIWLTKGFMKNGEKYGLTNGTYMYNPVRIKNDKQNNLNTKNISFIGRICPVKRVHLLAQIFNEFNKKNKDWKLLIYGSGEDKNIIKNKNIHLCGSTNDVKKELLNSDLLALTSSNEGFPMVVLEAYECGVPVITFNFKISCNEVVKDGETGFIVEMDNTKEYIEKLNKICNDHELRKQMGQNAKEYVKKFYPEKVAQRWYRLFKGEL